MRPFQFRAEVVLDLRKREEEAARAQLARARALADRAHGAVRAARDTVLDASRALEAAGVAGRTAGELHWHRSWILRLRAEVQTAMRVAAELDRASGAAAVAVGQAMQRRRVLERLRGRAWKVYTVARDRAHVHEMNELASLRFAALAQEAGGRREHHTDRRIRPHDGSPGRHGQEDRGHARP